MKKAEQDTTGGEHINDAVEMVGWGVEEAEKKHKAEASMLSYAVPFQPPLTHAKYCFLNRISRVNSMLTYLRSGNATCPSLCHPQVLHLCPSPADRSADAKSRQSATWMGLGYWKADDQRGESA